MQRPFADLQTCGGEISHFCRTHDEPLYLTEEGADDLVMMSRTAFERMADRFRLYALLEEGMEDVRAGRVIPAREAYEKLKADMENGTL